MDLDLWNGPPESEQQILLNATKIVEKQRYKMAETNEIESTKRLGKQGANVVEFSDERIMEIKGMVQKKYLADDRRGHRGHL